MVTWWCCFFAGGHPLSPHQRLDPRAVPDLAAAQVDQLCKRKVSTSHDGHWEGLFVVGSQLEMVQQRGGRIVSTVYRP